MDKIRLAFFADLHIQGNQLASQTDLGAPSKWIAQQAQEELNDINPDYIFNLGDMTAISAPSDWRGYKKWLSGVKAPVFDIFGNHDRDYTVFHNFDYGEEYFSILGRVSDTKAVKIGNLIFVLLSEEHNPEGNGQLLTSTVPLKKFKFIEEVLEEYSADHNVFVLSHTLLRGTTALSNDWSFNDVKAWKVITQRFLEIFDKYPAVAHLTGHTHMDYRYQAKLKNIEGEKYGGKVGKFINGKDYDDLPNNYFLNMPCVDTAHGWLGSNFAILRKVTKDTAKAKKSPWRRAYVRLENKGPAFFDFLYQTRLTRIWGRPAVYYFDVAPGQKEIKLITRWMGEREDVENYPVKLNQPSQVNSKKAKVVKTDLSLRRKENLYIDRDNWFIIPANQQGKGEFSQRFPKPKEIKEVKIEAQNLKDYTISYQKSEDGREWSKPDDDPNKLGETKAVKLNIEFEAADKQAQIKTIKIV